MGRETPLTLVKPSKTNFDAKLAQLVDNRSQNGFKQQLTLQYPYSLLNTTQSDDSLIRLTIILKSISSN